jgi:putative nucleotidyltransferase with HDIG domain
MTREEALWLVKKHVNNKNLIKHMLAAEAVMRGLAKHFGEDEEKWGLAGLLHDIDYDTTKDDPERHSLVGGEMLREMGLDEEIVHAVISHNEHPGYMRESLMDKALFCTDPLTGLIVAAALIHPDKKLSSIDPGFVLNRFGEKSFARGANREHINQCAEIGLTLEQFVEIAFESMKSISKDLGL